MNHTPVSPTVSNPNKVAYLFWNDNAGTLASQKAIGPSIALRVKAGESINAEVWTGYEKKTAFAKDFGMLALSSLLGNTFVSSPGFEGYTSEQVATSLQGALVAGAYPDDNGDGTKPYAYLNYVVFDQNKVYKDAGWVRVPEEAGSTTANLYLEANKPIKVSLPESIKIEEDGFVYIWVSNQSKEAKVWFDDLTVSHVQSIVVQATDYGVWGDVVREQKTEEKKYRFGYQGQFAEKDEETGWNHFELREYDPVVGRWTTTDSYGQHWSLYRSMSNNPINRIGHNGGVDDVHVDSKTGNISIIETDQADRIYIDGKLVGGGGEDGSWKYTHQMQMFLGAKILIFIIPLEPR